jgi:hypothetical protein
LPFDSVPREGLKADEESSKHRGQLFFLGVREL